jgi:hypothetical protein
MIEIEVGIETVVYTPRNADPSCSYIRLYKIYTGISLFISYFLCALGPISLLKAKYETSRLAIALRPTTRMRTSGTMAVRPMNRPGEKYWYFSKRPPSFAAFARGE